MKNSLQIFLEKAIIGWRIMRYMRDDLVDEYGILSLQDKILQIAVYIDEICENME